MAWGQFFAVVDPIRVQCTNCSDGASVGIVLAVVALVVSVAALLTSLRQMRLASRQTELSGTQTKLTLKQIEIAEREHAVFLAEQDRRPRLGLMVSLKPDFEDGKVVKPLAQAMTRRLEVTVLNDGNRGAQSVVVNVVAPDDLPDFRWVYADGQLVPGAKPPAPFPHPVLFEGGVVGVSSQYLDQVLDMPANAGEPLWVNVEIRPGVTRIPFEATIFHESLESSVLRESFVVEITEP